MLNHLRRSALGALLHVLIAVPSALACESGGEADAVMQRAAPCSIYMTEGECRTHQRILATLLDVRERNAYLAMYLQLMDERRALCSLPATSSELRATFKLSQVGGAPAR